MATIYQQNGQSLYDFNGQTYDARTGRPVSGTPQTPTAQAFQPVKPPKEPTVITSTSARDAVKDSINTLNTFNTNLALKQQQAQQVEQTKAQKPQTAPEPLILIDPNSLHKINVGDPSLNKDLVSQYLKQGYEVESGALPAGVFPSATGTTPTTSTENAIANANAELESLYRQFDNLSNLTPAQNAYINTIKQQFEQRKREMEDINRREQASLGQFGIASGAQRRSASFDSVVSEAERQGLQRLQELDAQELALIAEAQRAFEGDNFKVLTEKIALAQDIADRKQTELENIQKAAFEKNKEIREQIEAQRKMMETQSKLRKDEMDFMTGMAESIAPVALNALTGNEEEDAGIIADLARQYEIDPNVLLGAVQTLAEAPTKNVPADYNLLTQFLGRKPTMQEYTEFLKSQKESAGMTPTQFFSFSNAIADDVRQDPDIKDFIAVRDGYERVQAGANLNNAQGDLSLLFGYMKLLDPTSVVRETEFANAEAAMGYAQQVLNLPAKAIKGNRLTPQARQDFVAAADAIYRAKQENYNKAVDFYTQRAQTFGIPPELVLRDFTAPSAQTPTQELDNIIQKASAPSIEEEPASWLDRFLGVFVD